jgi:hypothetical protein
MAFADDLLLMRLHVPHDSENGSPFLVGAGQSPKPAHGLSPGSTAPLGEIGRLGRHRGAQSDRAHYAARRGERGRKRGFLA